MEIQEHDSKDGCKSEHIQPNPWRPGAKELAVRSLLSSVHQFTSMNPQNSLTKELFTFTPLFPFSRYSFCPLINALFFISRFILSFKWRQKFGLVSGQTTGLCACLSESDDRYVFTLQMTVH